MGTVLTLTGPSLAGKSTLLGYFLSFPRKHFQPIVVGKYTTRQSREDDGQEVICVSKIPRSCDLVYEQYGVRYGLELATIFAHLQDGLCPLVILNDVRAVEDVRAALGPLVRSIFLFRGRPKFADYSSSRHDANTRFTKAQSIYRIYIENIYLFDHVVLNLGSRSDLRRQALRIVQGLRTDPYWPLRDASKG